MHERRFRRARLLAGAGAVLAASLATAANAQSSPAPVPPIHQAIDGNGVDTVLDTFNTASTDVSIGQSARDGMAYTRYWSGYGWRDSLSATLTGDSTHVTVSIGGSSESFTNGVSDQGTGSTLSYNGLYTYTTSAGVVATFTPANGSYDRFVSNLGWATSITYPDGTRWGYTYKAQNYCPFEPGDYFGTCPMARSVRLQSVTNNLGYQMKMTYSSNTLRTDNDLQGWQTLVKVTAINNAVESCDPSADTCSLTNNWPSASYATTITSSGSVDDVTDALGRDKRYTYDNPGRMIAIRRPGFANDTTTISYGNNGVASVTNAGVTTNYAYAAPGGDTQTLTVTNALNQQSVVTATISTGLASSDRDALGNATSYSYDSSGRLIQVTAAEGNAVQYGYDARGNVTTTTLVAKPGSGLANIVTSASYPSGCTTGVTCNKPTSTTDARGNVTGYTYDPTHGGVTSVTAPAGANGIQPQTRYGYTSYNGIWRLTSTSTCRTQASCSGGADETRSTVAYTGTNLLATSMSSGAGDGSLSATNTVFYDNIGNVAAVDGPLPGSADTTNYYWDADRENTGTISPDPDGPGPLRRRQVVNHYILDGVADSRSVGTADADGNNFQALQTVTLGFDGNGRKVSSTLTAGGTTFGVTHYGYDAVGRLRCMAVRMNTGSWATPTDACTAQAAGAYGADRIAQVKYDQVGRPRRVISAAGTPEESDEDTTYTPNGQVATRSDAMFNLTTNVYDGFDRLVQRRFPSTTQGSSTSDAGNYESYGYDANGNLTSRRLRDGNSYTQSFDALDRLTNDGQGHSFSYDNVGHPTGGTDSNNAYENFGWDALGRKTSESALHGGTATMQYDAAGRRTRLTWADGFFVTYDYDMLGEMTGIHENGGTLLAGFAYDDLGRRTSLTRANGTGTGYGYDGASRLTGLSLNGGPANGYTFAYTPAGQIARRTSANDAFAWTGAVNTDRGYTTNGLNQYTQSGGVTPTYDGRGNLTSAGGATYGYDLQNRLTTFSGGYIYRNAFGQWLDVNTERQWMVHDDDRTIAEFGYDGTVHRRYVYGPGTDEPLVWYEGAGTNDRRFLHADERGSIVAVSDSGGGTIAINSYDEYGIPGANNVGRFQYTGQRWIPALGMYDYKARMYSPTLGRFLQTDPIGYGDGMNWYNYVGGDPVNATDPSGTDAVCGPGRISVRALLPDRANKPSPRGGSVTVTSAYICVIDPDSGSGRAEPQSGEPSTADVVVTGQRIAANQSCASALSAPGTCSLPYYEWLRLKQVLACQGIRTCTEAMTPDELGKQIEKRMDCAQARSKLNSQCFRGGDAGHNRAVDQLWDGVMKCQSVSIRKYGICPAPWAR